MTFPPLSDDSDALFQHILELAPDAMIIVDASGDMAIVNRQAEELFGYSRDRLVGRPIEMLIPAELRQLHEAHRHGFEANPKLRPMGEGRELVGQRQDGSQFPVEISLSPVEIEGRRFVYSVIRDVTTRRQMEDDIIAARRSAERANKANSAFLAAASHDLRQPVQALSLLNGALRRTVTDPLALEMIDNQDASIVAMTNLLNSLLDISRLDAGAVKPELETFPAQRLIDRLSPEFARQASRKGLEFQSFPCQAAVLSDPNLLSEIISNLVSNAIRYTDKGSIELRCIDEGDRCCVQVRDTGIGIAADQHEEIFREFHQCKTKGSSNEGFGLGLAIVRRLSNLLEHEVNVESEVGSGSCFSISVPIVANNSVDTDSENAVSPHNDGAADGLVILIEDDVNVANAWEMLLVAEGYRVATASSAREARVLVEHVDEVPLLVISDFHLLDGSTGVQAVRDIRDTFSVNIPAFVVSGDTSKVVKDARLLDNCTLMSKPIDTARLLAAARFAIQSGLVPED